MNPRAGRRDHRGAHRRAPRHRRGRDRRPRLHQHPPVGRGAPARARARRASRAATSAASTLGRGQARAGRVRLGEPGRADARRPRPLGGARRQHGARARARRLERASASSTSTTPACRWTSSRKSVAARYLELCGRTVEFEPRTGTRAPTSPRSRARSSPPRATRWADAPAAEREAHFRRRRTRRCSSTSSTCCTAWASTSTSGSRSARCTSRAPDGATAIERGDRARCARPATSTSTTARCGSARPTSATTRTACCVKADGEYTYFAADIAYHKDKFDRGFDRVINIWGADHHGYVPRMKAAVAALGHAGPARRGHRPAREPVPQRRGRAHEQAHRRDGHLRGAARRGRRRRRALLLPAPHHRPAASTSTSSSRKQQSADNPVYYVQYAHARICSILRKAAGDEIADARRRRRRARRASSCPRDADLSLLDRRRRAHADAQALRVPRGRRGRRARPRAAPADPLRRGPRRDVPPVLHAVPRRRPTTPALTAARLYAVDATRSALETRARASRRERAGADVATARRRPTTRRACARQKEHDHGQAVRTAPARRRRTSRPAHDLMRRAAR